MIVTLTGAGWQVTLPQAIERQVAAERERQRGWLAVCASSGNPPEQLPLGGELIYGPMGSHIAMEGAA